MSDSFNSRIKEFTAALNEIPKSEKNAETLTKIISSIVASQNILRELGSKGMVSELNEYIKTIEKFMASVEKINYPDKPKRKKVPKTTKDSTIEELRKAERIREQNRNAEERYFERIARRDKELEKNSRQFNVVNKKYRLRAKTVSIDPDVSEENERVRSLDEEELKKHNRKMIKDDWEAIRKKEEREFAERKAEMLKEEQIRVQISDAEKKKAAYMAARKNANAEFGTPEHKASLELNKKIYEQQIKIDAGFLKINQMKDKSTEENIKDIKNSQYWLSNTIEEIERVKKGYRELKKEQAGADLSLAGSGASNKASAHRQLEKDASFLEKNSRNVKTQLDERKKAIEAHIRVTASKIKEDRLNNKSDEESIATMKRYQEELAETIILIGRQKQIIKNEADNSRIASLDTRKEDWKSKEALRKRVAKELYGSKKDEDYSDTLEGQAQKYSDQKNYYKKMLEANAFAIKLSKLTKDPYENNKAINEEYELTEKLLEATKALLDVKEKIRIKREDDKTQSSRQNADEERKTRKEREDLIKANELREKAADKRKEAELYSDSVDYRFSAESEANEQKRMSRKDKKKFKKSGGKQEGYSAEELKSEKESLELAQKKNLEYKKHLELQMQAEGSLIRANKLVNNEDGVKDSLNALKYYKEEWLNVKKRILETTDAIQEQVKIEKERVRQEKVDDERLKKSKKVAEIEAKIRALEEAGIDINKTSLAQDEAESVKMKEKLAIMARLIEWQKLKIKLARQELNEADNRSQIPGLEKKLQNEEHQLILMKSQTREMNEQLKKIRRIELAQGKVAGTTKNWLASLIHAASNFFSIEKMVQRISFVITAKMSYDVLQFFKDIPRNAINAFTELEDEMSKTFALIAGTSEVTKKAMTDNVIDMAIKYGVAAKEISEALYEIVSAQVPMAQLNKVLEQSLKLSVGGAGDLRDAAKSLVQITNAYDESFENIERVSDIAFQTVKYGQLTMQQYTEQMQKVIATSSIFKIGQEEISAAIATMTINGVGAEQAFTALNQMLMSIANPTEKSAKLMKQLGISLTIKDVQELGLGGALERLIPLLNATDESGRELISILFKSRTGFKAVASLLQNMEGYGDNYINMLNSAGATNAALAERSETVSMALRRIKTTWDAMLTSIVSSRTNQMLFWIDRLSVAIKFMTTHSHLLWLAMKVVFFQMGTFGVVQISRLVTSLGGLRSALKTLASQATATGAQLSAAWASATLYLSVAIQVIVQAIHWFSVWAKMANDAKLEKITGAKEAAKNLETYEKNLISLDSSMRKLQGIEKMINAYNDLATSQDKTGKAAERSKKIYGDVSKILEGFSLKVIDGANNTINAAKTMVGVLEKIETISNRITAAKISAQSAKTRKEGFSYLSLVEQSQKITARVNKQKNSPAVAGEFSISPETLKNMDSEDFMTEREKAIVNATERLTTLYDTVRQVEMWSKKYRADGDKQSLKHSETYNNNLLINIAKQLKDVQAQKDAIKGVNNTKTNQVRHILSEWEEILLHLQNGADETTLLFMEFSKIKDIEDLKDLKVQTSSGSSKSEKSYLDDLQKTLQSYFGDTIFDTLDDFKAAQVKAIKKVIADMDEAKKEGTIIVDENETRYLAVKMEDLISNNQIVELFDAGNKAIKSRVDLTKSLYNNGNSEDAKRELANAKQSYDSYSKASLMTDEELSGRFFLTAEEIETFRLNFRKNQAEFVTSYFDAAKDIMTDSEYLNEALSLFGFKAEEIKTILDIDKLIKEAEANNQNDKAEALKTIREKMAESISDSIKEILGVSGNSEFFNEVSSGLKELMDSGKTQKEVRAAYAEIKKDKRISLNDKDKKDIDKDITDKYKKDGFSWKEAAGIPEYETQADMDKAMAQKGVDALKSVWSFYWNWELEQLKTQQEKKLELIKTEKERMLANSNMSAEQEHAISERYAEKERLLREKMDKQMAAAKRKQAIFAATIDYAQGLIGIWSSQLAKGDPVTALLFTGMLTAIFAAQMAMIQKQKFASGGLTGSGYGSPDETGHKPAGIVHAGELVIDKKTLDNNYNQLTGMYSALKSGASFEGFIGNYLMGRTKNSLRPIHHGSFATGGLVGSQYREKESPMAISIDFKGMKVIDAVDIAKMNIIGSKRMRLING
jgi:TP901 family phage tail tape measure protein